jgi:cell wall-associated NlpC family hydrolase
MKKHGSLTFLNILLIGVCSAISINCWSSSPIFLVTPNLTPQSQLISGQQGTALFQITNNSGRTLNDVGLVGLASGVSQVANAGDQYCPTPLNMPANSSCLIKLLINSSQISGGIQGGPKICFSTSHPIYCSQPLQVDQLNTQVVGGAIPQSCNANIANFNYELTQILDSTVIDVPTINSWGPARNHLLLSSANPNLSVCTTTSISNTANVAWMQSRVIAAEDFWVKQKLNYCHHHVTDFSTPVVSNGTPRAQIGGSDGGFCSNAVDIMPGTLYYNQPVRWNYSGTGSETSNNWLNNNYMWYGVDCSDFTSFVYNFAFGIQFNSDTGFQSGQATDGSQDTLTPNGQAASPAGKILQPFSDSNPNSPAGVLVCKNGQTEQELPECGGYGTNGYFSTFKGSDLFPTPSNITPEMLYLLQPGDLIFLGFAGSDGNNPTSMVTHVVTWTGKKVGYGADDINPSLIAPESICPTSFQPQVGDWVIIDSHYQGPDYRVFTPCFYQNHVWGVRRVIGYME